MDKIKEIFNFIKNHLNGKCTKATIGIILILLMVKFLGIVGILLSLLIAIGIDVCQTTNIKTIFSFFKNRFFPLFIVCMLIASCCAERKVLNSIYSISKMTIVNKDTVNIKDYYDMVKNKNIPSLKKFNKFYLKNEEENKTNAYYIYYDTINTKLYNVKELIENKDTLYIIEKKVFKE